ncbi:MAG: PAS domain S-box protein [Gammaproteobacteria bacterium]|nr:PAS domain S-box protein [Gammaproteobacteria bacterium]
MKIGCSEPWQELSFIDGLDAMPVMTWLCEPGGKRRYVNAAWLAFTGCSPEQSLGDGWLGYVHPDDRHALILAHGNAEAGSRPPSVEYRLYRTDGTFDWVHDRVTPLRSADGHLVGYLGCTLDTRARDQAEPDSLTDEVLNDRILGGNQYWTKLLDTEGRLLSMSAGGQRLLEIDDITPHLNTSWCETWPEPHRTTAYAAVANAAAGGTSTFTGFSHTVKGTPKWWDVIIVPAAKSAGNEPRLLAMFRDITEQRLAEEAVKRSEAEYRAIFELSAVGIVELDYPSKRFTKVNRRFCEIVGYSAAELTSLSVVDLTPSGRELEYNLALHRALETGERDEYALEKRLRRKDDRIVWVQVTATAVRDESGAMVTIVGMVEDISARKAAEQTLLDSEHRYRALMEHAGDAIVVADAQGKIIDVNRRAIELFGYSKRELLRLDLGVLYPRVLEGSNHTDLSLCEHAVSAGNGRQVPVEIAVTRIPYADSHLYLGSFRDISSRRRQEMAERASRDKTRFLATASHDLRQPIQAVNLLMYMLRSQDLPPAALALADRTQEAMAGLSRIVDALLDISKLDAGVVKPRLARFRLDMLVQELLDEHRPIADARDVTLRCVRCSIYVWSDRELLARILRNLISNAIKYTPAGRVLIGVRRKPGRAWIQVLDTGTGIAEGDTERVFEEFRQLGNSARDRRDGLGLGLSIVRRLAELLEHPVTVCSVVGRGSCFGVGVPVADGGELPSSRSPQRALRGWCQGGRILVVDDEVDIREGLAMVIGQWGYAVRVAADLAASMAEWDEHAAPMLVIADYRLGNVTGIDVIEAVRQRAGRNVAALLLTGDATAETLREASSRGIQVLRKPVAVEHLRRAILDCLNRAAAQERGSTHL